ncbi:MAG: DUF1080 domain-containing protein [Cyclobacteriaceae bacterium]|nr:DUF1080 domain-containing protein [Cyclobacteriaceae bacterium]
MNLKTFINPNLFILACVITCICSVTGLGQKKKDFKPIFDGTTLTGWEGDPVYWRVEDGAIVGEITANKLLKTNTFIIWKGGEPKNFELKLEYKITTDGNSGINYRSTQLSDVPHALQGYQADIDGKNQYTGQNYEERGRTTLAYRGQHTVINGTDNPTAAVRDFVKNNAWTKVEVKKSMNKDSLKSFIKTNDWNEVHLIIKENRLQHYVNGVLMSDVTDNDKVNRKMSGLIGVQVHVGPPMKVEYRNIMLKEL